MASPSARVRSRCLKPWRPLDRSPRRRAGRSYRRAWLLVDETNKALALPAVEAAAGGVRGGGAILTPVGHELVTRYREMESLARAASGKSMQAPIGLMAK